MHFSADPPPPDAVPSWVKGWHHVLIGFFYDKCCKFFTQMLAYLMYVAKYGTHVGAPPVEFVAFGADGFRDCDARQD